VKTLEYLTNLCLMLTVVLLVTTSTEADADNVDWFNKGMELGNSHKSDLKLNKDSNMSSFGKANDFKDVVAENANLGNTPAKDMYTHVAGDGNKNGDPNYLYNSGTQMINDCEKSKDAKCTTLNKYGDKDTQTQIQAYTQHISSKYLISVSPDPTDKECSIVKRKQAINTTIHTCDAGLNTGQTCLTVITPYSNYNPPTPADGTAVVNASNNKQTDVYAGIEVKLTVSEMLTKQNQITAHIVGSSPDMCGWDYRTFDGLLSLGGSATQKLADSGNYGCNGGHRYVVVSLEASTGCNASNVCTLNFLVQTGWGKDGRWHNGEVRYQAIFNKQSVSNLDNGFTLDDQCAAYR